MVEIVEIRLKINGEIVALPLLDARQLYLELHELLAEKVSIERTVPGQLYPSSPIPTPMMPSWSQPNILGGTGSPTYATNPTNFAQNNNFSVTSETENTKDACIR